MSHSDGENWALGVLKLSKDSANASLCLLIRIMCSENIRDPPFVSFKHIYSSLTISHPQASEIWRQSACLHTVTWKRKTHQIKIIHVLLNKDA